MTAQIIDFYKYLDKYENGIRIKTFSDSSRQSEAVKERKKSLDDLLTVANKFCLGIYDEYEGNN